MGEVRYIERAVISYCDIPDELTEDSFLQEYSPDCYVEYLVDEEDELGAWIIKEHPELKDEFILIEIDY